MYIPENKLNIKSLKAIVNPADIKLINVKNLLRYFPHRNISIIIKIMFIISLYFFV